MKTRHKSLIAISTGIIALLVIACEMVVEQINFPDDAKVNSEITVKVKLKLVTETDDNSRMVFAVLAPKSWNLKNNSQLTLTTDGYASQGYSEVTDEQLTVIPDNETEKSTALSYPVAYQSKIGLMGNKGPVEWTVFKSSTIFHINDKVSTAPIYGYVTMKIKTGPTPIKFFLGIGFCGTTWGLDKESGEGRYTPNETAKEVIVHGELNDDGLEDYTVTPSVSTVPSTLRYGDIFSIVFDASETELKGASNVVLCGKAILSNGETSTLENVSEDRIMDNLGDNSFRKYIYPKQLFSVPTNVEIEKMYVWFISNDGTIMVKEGEDGHFVAQASE